ncbi:MAG: cytochrome c peroxidase [Lacinutrix sp.]|uniref:cytochrome-c peroxidase n=1 Tax=Lacinutrix sp. TaxID=1937692 RepID=UPI003096CDC7
MKNRIIYLLLIIFVWSCSKENASDTETYEPTPLPLSIPQIFLENIIPPVIPNNNPQTVEGVALGKKLFFDTKLSGDQTMACASCHAPQNAFTDNIPTSIGIDGDFGNRNSMPIYNLAWNYGERFTWDGKELSLERQALEPVENPVEMHSDWDDVIDRLQSDAEYPELFRLAFKTNTITKELTAKAIAQFERTLISANSKFDNYSLGQATVTPQEQNGFNVFMDEERGDCFHCHGNTNNPLWTDNIFHNNGLDTTFADLGLGGVTGDSNDNGKFKSPSLRNLAYTAPYMHDGRFETLEEVIEFYSSGLQQSSTIDPLMKKVDEGGVNLSMQDKADLKAFLLALSDPTFLANPDFQE